MKLKYLFFIERDLHIPILQPIWEYILVNNIGNVAFFTLPNKPPKATYPGQGLTDKDIFQLTKYGLFHSKKPFEYCPDITFIADHNFHFVEGFGKIVNLGHGTIAKGYFYQNTGISKRENIADLICVPGKIHKEKLKKVMFKPIKVTGMPKLDKNFKHEIDKNILYKKFKLDPLKKTILFAPTFNPELSILPFINIDLRLYIPKKFNLIIKLHGATCVDLKNKYANYYSNSENVYYSDDVDISPLFELSNVLLSDVSSSIYEFSVLNKPVVIYDSPLQKDFENYNSDDIEYKFRDIGIRFNNLNELPSILEKVTSKNFKTKKNTLKTVRRFVSISDGTSAKKVVESSIKIMSQNEQNVTLILNNTIQKNSFNFHRLNKYRGFQIGNNIPAIPFTYINTNSSFNINEALRIILPKVKTKYLVYIDTSNEISPFIIESLTAHFVYDKDLKIISPIVCSRKANAKIQPFSLSIQLGYKFAGESLSNQFSSLLCFAVKTSFIKKICSKSEVSNSDFISAINKSLEEKKQSKIALDALIFPYAMKEELNKNIEIINPKNSIYQNLAYLNQNIFDRIISFQMKDKKKWSNSKILAFYINLGSVFKNYKNYTEALKYLLKAEKIKDVKSPNILGRLYFHLGETYSNLNNINIAKEYYQKCLQLIPTHEKAIKLIGK